MWGLSQIVFCVLCFFFKFCHADVCSTVYFSAVVIWAFGLSSIASVNIVWGGMVMSYTADSQQGALGVLSSPVFGSSHVADFKSYPGNRNLCVAGSEGSLTGSLIKPLRLTQLEEEMFVLPGTWSCTAPPDVWLRTCCSPWWRPALDDFVVFSVELSEKTIHLWPLTSWCHVLFCLDLWPTISRSGQSPKTGFWTSCLQSWGFWMRGDLCLFFDQKSFQLFLHRFWFLSQQNYHKIVLLVKKCASFTSQTFIKTAESWVHLLLWTWQNICCVVLKWKNNQREPILFAAWWGEEASWRGMNFYSCTADCLQSHLQPCKWGRGRGRVCASVCQTGEGTQLVCGRWRCECVSAHAILSCRFRK